jgi:MFS family permease
MTTVASTALGSRFWKLWSATVVSSLGDGLYRVALPLLAAAYTRDAFLVSLVSVCLYLPWLLFALPVGAYGDRKDRRKLVIVSQGVRFTVLILFAVAVVLKMDSFWLLCLLALLLGSGELLFAGTASAMMPMLVDRQLLPKANSRLFAVRQLAESFIGQAGGGLFVSIAVAAAVATTGSFYLIAMVAILLIPGRYQPKRDKPTPIRRDIVEGVRFLMHHRVLRTLALVGGGLNLANTAFMAVFVLYVVGKGSAMNLPDWGYGLLLTVTAIGATVGSLLTAKAQRRYGRVTVLGAALATPIVAQAVPALTANVIIVGVAFVLHGTGIAMWNVIGSSLRQRSVPTELMGRVNSGIALLSWGSMPLGAIIGGVLATWLGLRGMFAITAALSLCLLLSMRVFTEREMAAAEAEGDKAAGVAA